MSKPFLLRLWLILGLVLPVYSAAQTLVIDPSSFEPLPEEDTYKAAPSKERKGPMIRLELPKPPREVPAGEQIAVTIHFLPGKSGAQPNMDTIDVEIRKGWFGKRVTDQVRPYIEGSSLVIPSLDLSGHTGKFNVDIKIKDLKGESNQLVWGFKIKK